MIAREITRRRSAVNLVGAGLALLGAAAAAQPSDERLDERLIASFLSTLRRGVAAHDVATVALVIQFPLIINAGLPVPLRDADSLKELYDAFFTPGLQRAIQCAPVERSAAGLTIGTQLFAAKRDGAFKIIRMTGAPVKPKPKAAPPAPRRVIFPARGYRLARYAGTLQADGVESYVIWVRKNEVLRATLTGFAGRGASLRVTGESGAPPDARAADVPRTWVGPVPDTGDYRIDVVRRAAFCDPAVVYDLEIRLQ